MFTRIYKIDVKKLNDYMHSPESKTVHKNVQGNDNQLSNRAILGKLLKTVRNGECVVMFQHYDNFTTNQLPKLGITHGRVKPVDHYTCAFACLPKDVRSLALFKDYVVFDMSKCYHRIALGLTKDDRCKEVLTEFLSNGAEKMRMIAEFYDVEEAVVKTWFHAFSNGKQKANWLRENDLSSTHEFIDEWINVQTKITDDLCAMYADALLALGCKSKLRSYVMMSEESKAREAMEAHFGIGLGPPMHDGISVLKHGIGSVEDLADQLTQIVSETLGYEMVVDHEPIQQPRVTNMCTFSRDDFISNYRPLYDTYDEYKESLDAFLQWCQRHFVCMTKMDNDVVVEIEYKPGTEQLHRHIMRTVPKTKSTHPGMLIVTKVLKIQRQDRDGKVVMDENGKPLFAYKPDNYTPLLDWYLSNDQRREADRVGVYFTDRTARMHPRDLNVFAGLPFDDRYASECKELESKPFKDPFDSEPDWHELEGLDFLLWHLKYNLHDGDSTSFEYCIRLDAYAMQFRKKPGVLVLYTGVQGTGKTAVFGTNEGGPGIYPRMYGDSAQQYNNVDTLLKNFNADSMGKLYCVLEEANPGGNTRNNNQLKDIITGGTQRIEKKGIDPFTVDDARMFKALSQDVPFKIEQGDRRYVVNRTRDTYSPSGVLAGMITQEQLCEFGAKLDRIKSDDEVTYEFFRLLMSMDLSEFDKTALPMTDAKKQAQQETGCRVEMWLRLVYEMEIEYHECTAFAFSDDKVCMPIEADESATVVGHAPRRMALLYERFNYWHTRALPGTYIRPNNENAFAQVMNKHERFVSKIKKRAHNVYVLHTKADGRTKAWFEEDEQNDEDV